MKALPMNCRDLQQELAWAATEAARPLLPPALRQHLAECGPCAARYEEWRAVSAAQLAVAEELTRLPLPEPRPRRQAVADARGHGVAALRRWLLPAGAVAAAIALAAIWLRGPHEPANSAIINAALPATTVLPGSEGSFAATASLASYRHLLASADDSALERVLARDADALLPSVSPRETQPWRGKLGTQTDLESLP